MNRVASIARQPRKTPVQARSQATVQAIFQATLQVLLRDGQSRLTTTRVAERAGVSVGTLYQYYPNKQALLTAILAEHMNEVARAVEAACVAMQGQPATRIVAGVVEAFLDAKLRDMKASAALYAISSNKEGVEVVRTTWRRMRAQLADLLRTVPGFPEERVDSIVFMMSAAMSGASRAVLEGGPTPQRLKLLRTELVALCEAYVGASVNRLQPVLD